MPKGQERFTLMDQAETIEQLNKLVDNLFGPVEKNIFGQFTAPFDITRPNIHDNKKEFTRELTTVSSVIDHLQKTLGLLVANTAETENDPLHSEMLSRLTLAIETNIIQQKSKTVPESAGDLALQNLRETGFYYNSVFVMLEMLGSFRHRFRDLKEQEVEFWSVPNRPPNYHARIIALRFARFFASKTGKRPTFGISSEGSHPSTEYGRALEEVFKILKIRADVRKAAEWALSQVTEEDWKPTRNALAGPMGSLYGIGGLFHPRRSSIDPLIEALQEKGA